MTGEVGHFPKGRAEKQVFGKKMVAWGSIKSKDLGNPWGWEEPEGVMATRTIHETVSWAQVSQHKLCQKVLTLTFR